jgi:hypothetical protein
MRNPLNSWDNSDSIFYDSDNVAVEDKLMIGTYEIGQNDLKLMKKLSKAGNDHSKFLRMINVTVDITAPLYWWKEFDTYKVGTVANSCSTMHKIHDKEFTLDDFSCEHLINITKPTRELIDNDCVSFKESGSRDTWYWTATNILELTIETLNTYRQRYLETKDKKYWWQMIQLLPSSYNQKRTVQLNYQVLKSMYNARWNHKLDEWVYFCEWMHDLPYFKEIVLQE